MKNFTTAALFFLAAGILTSVSILSVYQILFAIPLCYYTWFAVKNKQVNLPKSAWFLLAFIAVALLSLVVNYDLIPKPSKNFGRLKYFLFGVGGIFVYRAWINEASDSVKKFLVNIFLISIIIAGGCAIYSFAFSSNTRARGLTDIMRYGYGSAMLLLTLLSALFHREKIKAWFDWRVALVAFVFGFAGMYLTYTRGALLGFLCGLPFVLYFYRPKLGLYLGGLAVLGVLGLGSIYLFGSGNYESRFLVNKNNESDVIRRSQWQAAMIATQEKPFLGWGLSNFHSQLKRIKNQYDLDAKYYNSEHSHNLFLEIMSGTGVIGLLFFLGWLISWAIESFKFGGLKRALIVPFGVAFVVSSQFEVTFDANNVCMIFFLYSMTYSEIKKSNSLNA
ncbi:O-antigen ligase family protein [Peredibacter sp. HCB2-198]|uniref:O-antigen ligase family protein n=1 Tax=Peredibacter sp. HCB2-198 TaxID=3383025 RepID=UPI0038B49C60